MSRPAVDVVVPFRGTQADRDELRERLSRLKLRSCDTVLIVDNTPGQERTEAAAQERILVSDPAERPAGGSPERGVTAVRVLVGPGRRVPANARNRGAARGSAPWILYLDDDVEPPEDLLDRYFDSEPASSTALLAGGVRDQFVPSNSRPAARYAYIRAATSQDDTFRWGEWAFPKTANLAVRRAAFEAVGGFHDHIRAAEDSDLTYRLRAIGWTVERREGAAVIHRSRQTLRSFIVQKATHGSGAAWLDRHYPGACPPGRRIGLLWWGFRTAPVGLLSAARSGDRDRAIWALFHPVEAVAFEFGRSLPNERPLTFGVWLRAIRQLFSRGGR